MAREKKVRVRVVPTQGEAQDREAVVPMRGATVRHALEALGLRTTDVDIMVDGQPATLETKITARSKVRAEAKGAKSEATPKVTVTERPRGS